VVAVLTLITIPQSLPSSAQSARFDFLPRVWYTGIMNCEHIYELDLDGLVACTICKHVVDDANNKLKLDFWESQISFEE